MISLSDEQVFAVIGARAQVDALSAAQITDLCRAAYPEQAQQITPYEVGIRLRSLHLMGRVRKITGVGRGVRWQLDTLTGHE